MGDAHEENPGGQVLGRGDDRGVGGVVRPAWYSALTFWERGEIELAQFYAANLRHKTLDHDRLILLAKMAALLDRATGFSGVKSLEVGYASFRQAEAQSEEDQG